MYVLVMVQSERLVHLRGVPVSSRDLYLCCLLVQVTSYTRTYTLFFIDKSQRGGRCMRHGAANLMKKCSHEGCTRSIVNSGVWVLISCIKICILFIICFFSRFIYCIHSCMQHGAKRPTCKHEGCTNLPQKAGLCKRRELMCMCGGCAFWSYLMLTFYNCHKHTLRRRKKEQALQCGRLWQTSKEGRSLCQAW